MGARPIALLDGLWFGAPDHHFERAVAGIGDYGNSVGVANVGGATVFDEAYRGNCLVNAMCVGLLDTGRLQSAKAQGPGNLVVLYGATTGRDGIGGASVLASQELGEDDPDKRPSVQVGDPFTGKKLIEVSMELVESGLVESLQDCGAAGLASALSEMARDGAGIDVHLDRVPLRESGMEPWEIIISESQERMVAVVRPQMLAAERALCAKWELPCTVIGEVTDSGALRASGETTSWAPFPRAPHGRVPALRDRAVAERDAGRRPSPRAGEPARQDVDLRAIRPARRFAHRPPAGLDAAVLRLRPSLRGLAISLQGPRPGEADPFAAGVQAVLGAARNVACAGGEPIGLTDCLNFGNPEKPEIAWELAQAIEGIAQAAEALGIPVVSGNVSLYNETDGRPIPPTPVVGCVGLVPDVRLVPDRWEAGDVVLLASAPEAEPRGGGGADPLPLEGVAAAQPLPRRRRRWSRAGARGGGALERPRGRRLAPGRGGRRRGGRARSRPETWAKLGTRGLVQIGEVR